MKLPGPRVAIALLAAGAVAAYVVRDLARVSPGPLAAVHARRPELSGLGSCANCHGGWFGSMADACLECHAAIGGQIERRSGLHGALPEAKARRCGLCHSEHHGEDFPMVNRQSFAEAGAPRVEAFDHRLVGFAMEGRHLELQCAECHANADLPVLPEGATRFLGLTKDCASCHEDPHAGSMVIGCAECHGQESFAALRAVGHERRLPLVGGHGELSCRTCHGKGEAYALEAVAGGRVPAPRDCLACHASPHSVPFVEGAAKLAGAAPGSSCGTCHLPEHGSFREKGTTVAPERHAAAGFPLTPPHADVACGKCHDPARASFAERYPGRAPDDCARCHEDPHGGQFDEARCVTCHETTRFEPHAFTVEKHAATPLPLTGRHLETGCEACHPRPAEEAPRRFRGVSATCDGCHADAHAGYFHAFDVGLAYEPAGTCARCHTTAGFRELGDGGFDHNRFTPFPCAGAHAQAACETCHPRAESPDAAGRTFGRAGERFGPYAGCATCHEDPHDGRFDRPPFPPTIEGRTDCARCHTETSFRDLPGGFDHGLWTGYALEGKHAEAACSKCHAPRRRPDARGRTSEPAMGTRCDDCHADPHGGQFESLGATDCRRCHRSAASFSDLSFRHDLDARFRLGEAHAGVPCAACHTPVRMGTATVVRYRPMAMECADCHAAQQDPLGRRKGKRE